MWALDGGDHYSKSGEGKVLQVSACAEAPWASTMDVIRRQGTHCFHSLIKAVTNAVTSWAAITVPNYLCQVKLSGQGPIKDLFKAAPGKYHICNQVHHKDGQNKRSNLVDILKKERMKERFIGQQGISQDVRLIPVNSFLRVTIKELMHAGCSQRKQMILS